VSADDGRDELMVGKVVLMIGVLGGVTADGTGLLSREGLGIMVAVRGSAISPSCWVLLVIGWIAPS
jgi:hypothetical protein